MTGINWLKKELKGWTIPTHQKELLNNYNRTNCYEEFWRIQEVE